MSDSGEETYSTMFTSLKHPARRKILRMLAEKPKNFSRILEEPVSAHLWPHIREEPLELIPYWYVVLQLDNVYPGNVNSIGVGIWADTGEVSGYKTISAR